MYVVNQPTYPDINGLKPDFYALKLIVPGLYTGLLPVGLTSINFSDKRESGKLRGNAPVMIGKTQGKYSVKASMEMYMNDFYNGFLPFIGNIGLPQGLGAYEVPFGLDLIYSTPNDPLPKDVQLVGLSIGEVTDDDKEGQEALKVKIDFDEPFMLVRNGIVPMDVALTTWPTSQT